MFFALVLYALVLLLLGIKSFYLVRGYQDFAIAGHKQKSITVALSLLATTVGSSATFGLMSLSAKHGFPAFWWLGVGAIFLALQALLLSSKVRSLNAYSLPHVARLTLGRPVALLISITILASWIGIIAAQFTTISEIAKLLAVDIDTHSFILISGLLVILYTVFGGQLAVMKTDGYQFLLLFSGVLCAFFILYASNYTQHFALDQILFDFSKLNDAWARVEFFNASFAFSQWAELMVFAGLAFFIGPDVFSRVLAAKDVRSAKVGLLIASVILAFFAFIMALIGVYVVEHSENTLNPLASLVQDFVPKPLAVLLIIGLISALVSSADTCLISTAVILENDILQGNSLKRTRITVLAFGVLALLVALYYKDIIKLLLTAYSIYVPGIVIPLFFGIMNYQKRVLNQKCILIAVAGGALLGLVGTLMNERTLAFYGLIFSFMFSLLALFKAQKYKK